jgi:hypothetical protein
MGASSRPSWVKNGPDAIEMECLCYPRKQTSVSAAAMTDPDPNPFADCDVIVCYGGAKLFDKHLASIVLCIDDEIICWLEHREQRLACSCQSAYKHLP